MPVVTRKQGGKWRLFERDTGRLARNDHGTPLDGGGHIDKGKAARQERAINESLAKKYGGGPGIYGR